MWQLKVLHKQTLMGCPAKCLTTGVLLVRLSRCRQQRQLYHVVPTKTIQPPRSKDTDYDHVGGFREWVMFGMVRMGIQTSPWELTPILNKLLLVIKIIKKPRKQAHYWRSTQQKKHHTKKQTNESANEQINNVKGRPGIWFLEDTF